MAKKRNERIGCEMTTNQNPAQTKNILVGIGSIFAVCLICICVWLFIPSKKEPPDYKFMSYVMCQLYVEENLKSPSTADFPASSLTDIRDLGNNLFETRSYVDSQNSFGATIRTNFFCKIQYIGTPEDDETLTRNWLLLELTFPQ